MRAALATKDKQLSLAKRSVEFLGAERDQLMATVANDQAHTRKLEVKLMGQQGLVEITTQWKTMKAKVRLLLSKEMNEGLCVALSQLRYKSDYCIFRGQVKSMEETVRAAESKILACEEVQRRQKAEINTLRSDFY